MILINGSMFSDEPAREELCPDCHGNGDVPCRSGHTDCTVDCGWCKGAHVQRCALCRGAGVMTYTRQ